MRNPRLPDDKSAIYPWTAQSFDQFFDYCTQNQYPENSKHQRSEEFTYYCPYGVSSVDFCNSIPRHFISSSCLIPKGQEGIRNFIEVVNICRTEGPELRSEEGRFVRVIAPKNYFERVAIIQQHYPATKLLVTPANFGLPQNVESLWRQWFVTSSEAIRIYKAESQFENQVSLELAFTFYNSFNRFNLPITSFDLKENHIVTSQLDGTCAIWDLKEEKITAQTVSHDKEVFDVSFSPNDSHLYASCGADGVLQILDTRKFGPHTSCLNLYKSSKPMIKVDWNNHPKIQQNLIAGVEADSKQPIIIDSRKPQIPLYKFTQYHQNSINAIKWLPHNSLNQLCTGAVDGVACTWKMDENRVKEVKRQLGRAQVNCISYSNSDEAIVALGCRDAVHFAEY